MITNTQSFSYWTNFDGADAMFIDEITLLIWMLGILSLLGCSYMAKTDSLRDEDEIGMYQEEE